MIPRVYNDLAEDIARWHVWHRVKRRCQCGHAIKSPEAHRVHIAREAIEEGIGRVRADAFNTGYEQGWDDASTQ